MESFHGHVSHAGRLNELIHVMCNTVPGMDSLIGTIAAAVIALWKSCYVCSVSLTSQ